MSTATIPFALAYAAPVRSPIRWVAGSTSVALAVAAGALSVIGHGASVGGAVGDAWVSAMFAVLSIAAAVAGFACGATDATFGKGNRTLSVLGALCNVAFAGLFYAVWC